jgi:Cu/Ag efflux protein CusF
MRLRSVLASAATLTLAVFLPVAACAASELDASKLGITMMPMTKGIIEGVNWQAKEITLSHERIYDINLAPETTTFKVRDIKTLRAFHPGDSVYFIADRIKGAPIVIKLLERHPE